MYKPHHGPLSNNWVLISFLAAIIAASIWQLSPAWGFLLVLFSIIVFLSAYISAVRAPLMSDEEIELAVHEKYHGRRYPDTDLHHGHLPKSKKYVHSRHKKKLVELHLAKRTVRKASPKKRASKKAKRAPAKRAARKAPAKNAVRKAAVPAAKKRVAKKTARKKR